VKYLVYHCLSISKEEGLAMQWAKEEGLAIQWAKEEGLAIQWAKEEGLAIQWAKEVLHLLFKLHSKINCSKNGIRNFKTVRKHQIIDFTKIN
jgi:hypothetical protein